MKKICFATNNLGKLQEIKELLAGKYEVVSLADIGCTEDIPETKDTFEGNSMDKALFVFEKYNIDCFADDSGLEVEILDNAPGVYSARYSGTPKSDDRNMELLLKNMEGKTNRKACFRTVVTLILKGKSEQFKGVVQGEILTENKGLKGFGYDPIFVPIGYNQTFAEMSSEQKNSISHRGQAVRKLIDYLQNVEEF